jgi:hypothetical protein
MLTFSDFATIKKELQLNRHFRHDTTLEKIDHNSYLEFIEKQFALVAKKAEKGVFAEILEWTNRHTYYVQLLCNKIYAQKQSKITPEVWKTEAHKLLKEEELFFINYRNMLTKPQWHLFKAFAKEGEVYAPTSKGFISKNHLGSPATVLRSLNTLMKSELLYKGYTLNGMTFYSVYDVLFQRWAESR